MPKSDDLLKEIMARRAALKAAPQRNALAQILDSLNAFDTLESLTRRLRLTYGPKVITRGAESMGVVVWKRAPGYHGYKILTLTGLWVALRDDQPYVLVGSKTLAFSAPFYDADAYHKIIRSSYDLYYQDDNLPPVKPAFTVRYAAEQRLELREIVARELAKCL